MSIAGTRCANILCLPIVVSVLFEGLLLIEFRDSLIRAQLRADLEST